VTNSQAFVFGVDLDGVVVDFYGGLRTIAAEWLEKPIEELSKEVSYGLPEWGLDIEKYELLHRYAVTQKELFRNLRPIHGAPTALRRLSQEGIRIRIITHRLFIKYFHQTAIRQTVDWLDMHDVPYWDLCFMKDKAAVGADLYIDDTRQNIEALRADGHPTIVYTNTTNLGISGPRANNWDEVATLVLQYRERWCSDGKLSQSAGH
jgi:5'(3')-deoxyribonucleotidase